jgi:ZIP family zinc transporter
MKKTGGEGSKVMPASFPWCLVYFGIDKVLPHLHINFKVSEGIKSPWQRTTLLVSAITQYSGGLAVGVLLVEWQVFRRSIAGAAIGIGIQNFQKELP